jgi:tetratricopeptide (TPR) repeat protein
MRLALLTFAVIALGSTPALADIVILPPLGAAKNTGPVASALANAGVGKMATLKVDATCAGDPRCLANKGSELSADRIVAIVVTGSGKVDMIVVDVGAKLLLGTRSLSFAPKKLAKELGPAVSKTIEEMTVDKAKSLFAEGNESYNLGEFEKALDRYKLAYRVKPLPAFQFNIAQCHRKLAQHKEAIAMYQAYLVGVQNAPNKEMVEGLIDESKKAIEQQAAAQQQFESQKLDTEKKKAEEARKAKEAEAAAAAERAKVEQAQIAAERERAKGYNKHPARKFMFVTAILGVATAGTGAYFGIQARDAQSAFDTAQCGDPTVPRTQPILDQCNADKERGTRAALLGNVLVGSGGAVLLISAIIYAIDPGNIEAPKEKRVAVGVSPTSVQVVFKW